MRQIRLGGKYGDLSVKVDDADFDLVSPYVWLRFRGPSGVVYARRHWRSEGRQNGQFIHTLITGWVFVDHINHDGLDNRRANLRASCQRFNERNARKQRSYLGKPTSSQYKGVHWHRGRWVARIGVDGRRLWLGQFAAEAEAAHAYDDAARLYFGTHAQLNFDGGRG